MAMELNEAPELILSALSKVKTRRCCIGFWTCGTRVRPLNDAQRTIDTLKQDMQAIIRDRAECARINGIDALKRQVISEQVKSAIQYLEATLVDQNLTQDYKNKLNIVLEDLQNRKPDETTRLLEEGALDSSETQSRQKGGGYQQDLL